MMFPGMVFAGAFFAVFLILGLAFYIYAALALMTIAKKTKTENAWMAWVPILNVYLLTQIAGLHGLWTLIVLLPVIPVIGSVAMLAGIIYIWWLVAEKLGRPGWWSLLLLIPIVNLVVIGIMAWGEEAVKKAAKTVIKKATKKRK
ncbi:hypothetical protein COY27_05900 [Candidatus Woesearchaeota archaeon CG_4_10_14_0_2_um_filter_33_13]|nr:MAG: hypothetical protein COY27_05900 [Candidatus Woesearchaeota archaeon CG_4_10_14_0_2_um_filter_33_13]